MEQRFGFVAMLLSMLSGVAVYIIIQQIGIIEPIQIAPRVVFDAWQGDPYNPKNKK